MEFQTKEFEMPLIVELISIEKGTPPSQHDPGNGTIYEYNLYFDFNGRKVLAPDEFYYIFDEQIIEEIEERV